MEKSQSEYQEMPGRFRTALWGTVLFCVGMMVIALIFWTLLPESRPVGTDWAKTLILSLALPLLVWKDLRERRLPDLVTLPLLLAGLMFSLTDGRVSFLSALAGSCCAYLVIIGLRAGYRAIRNVDGMGLGDAKLLAAAGAWFGLLSVGPLLLMSSTVGLCLIALQKAFTDKEMNRDDEHPFGPAIAASIWIFSWGSFLFPLS